jgi:hypothetical protein
LPLDPRLAGSNQAEDNGFLKSVARLPSEGKYSDRSHAVTFYGMLKILVEHERDTSYSKFAAISLQVSPASLLGVSAGSCNTAQMDESGMIRSQMWTYN